MLSDRPYMRDDYQREKTSVVVWLICAIVAAFILGFVAWHDSSVLFGAQALISMAVNTGLAPSKGMTLPFLSYGGSSVVALLPKLSKPSALASKNGLPFAAERVTGTAGFGGDNLNGVLYLHLSAATAARPAALCVSSLTWAAVNWRHGGTLFGAMAAVNALFVFFACLHPNEEINLLLFFLLPVRLKPKPVPR